ncbi:MAG: hypothetical protein ABJA89_18690 [Lapillicoccus sp.]
MRPPTPLTPPPGAVAVDLPVPSGDPTELRRAAAALRLAAGEAVGCHLATGPLPTLGWAGLGADAARADGALVGSRVGALADRAARAGAVLAAYADALEEAQRVTAGLQASSAVAMLADPTALLPGVTAAVLVARYAGAVADLELATEVATHRLRELAGEVGDGPAGRGGQSSAWMWGARGSDPDPHAAAWAGLGLVAGQRHREEGERVARVVVETLASAAGGDPWAVDGAATLLERWGRDPVFGAALWSRLSPEQAALLVSAAETHQSAPGRQSGPGGQGGPGVVDGEWLRGRSAVLLAGLGASLAVFVNPAYAVGADPVAAERLVTARRDWLARTAPSVGRVLGRPDGSAVSGAWVQGRLLSGMVTAGLSPGTAYAASVGVGLVTADPALAGAAGDPVLTLTLALRGDVEAARAWLLHPLSAGPGAPDRMVVDHLVADRYLDVDPAVAARSMSALGRLVLEAGSDPRSADSTLVAAAYLGAVGRTLVDGPRPDVFGRALAPALDDLGRLLGGHADAVSAVLDASQTPGTDASALTPAQRLVRQGRTADTWEIVLADRPTAAALLGALALADPGGGDAPAPSGSPALALALGGIGASLERDLAHAVAAGASAADATDVAARRLGATTGFVLVSAGSALAGRAAARDAQDRALLEVADLAAGKLAVPGAAGKVATPLVRAAAGRVLEGALPIGAEAAQRAATTAAVAWTREDALVAGRTLVSRAYPFTPEQSPSRWAARSATTRSPVVFWDAAGRPWPEDEMTTAQRRSFADWRRDEGLTAYDTVPRIVRDGIDEGVRDGAAGATVY